MAAVAHAAEGAGERITFRFLEIPPIGGGVGEWGGAAVCWRIRWSFLRHAYWRAGAASLGGKGEPRACLVGSGSLRPMQVVNWGGDFAAGVKIGANCIEW